MHPVIQRILDDLITLNEGQPEFHQAATEVLSSLGPVVEQTPALADETLLRRMVEPERHIEFRVPWIDDQGNERVNRGWRVQFSSALGPYKGGLRFHPTVTAGTVRFLAFEQMFKNALTNQRIGAGKGGANINPKTMSVGELQRFCQSFMLELSRHIGPNTDVPAGDIGVGSREIGWLFGQYKRVRNAWDAGTITGKDLSSGGAQIRTEATGYGLVMYANEMLGSEDWTDRVVSVSGSGNVAIYAIKLAQQQGAKVITFSDSSGVVVDEQGVDLELLQQIKEVERGRVADYVERRPGAKLLTDASVWTVPTDIALPCATQNELHADDAKTLVDNGVKLVAEGANMPSTNEAIEVFLDSNTPFGPGKAANAGGVAVSALEMAQNAARDYWTFEESQARLRNIMKNIHTSGMEAAETYGMPGNLVAGSNIAGYLRVAEAMRHQGSV
ncbi:NADP-specific glutamate dehydrogenase [Stomatohabitans albus]|uniref:NADP-specific glutamate dehydrogenase n=1 Tax=Stomatohabitans albus TaxID=3110766 RepID=UPI00300C29B6